MTITSRGLSLLIPVTMVVGIALGSVTGWWQTESSKDPTRYSDTEFGGTYAGLPNPADIRGSYSLGDIEEAFGVPVAVLAEAFLLTGEDKPEAVLLKEFEERYGILPAADSAENEATREFEIGTDAMRLFVARYIGLPYEPESDTGIFDPAYRLVVTATRTTGISELDQLERRIVLPPGESTASTTQIATDRDNVAEEGDEYDGEEYLVKGNTTFGQILSWGVAEADVRALFEGDIGARGEQVRTWCIEREIAYSSIKEDLQRLVDDTVR